MNMKLLAVSFLLVSLFLTSSLFDLSMAGSKKDDGGSCDDKCAVRCSKAEKKDKCLKHCKKCCDKCHCVPSDTYGHKDECPCYRDMNKSKDEPKCP